MEQTLTGLWMLAVDPQNAGRAECWCLFVSPSHGYTGRPFSLEAVLATEDALAPGSYPVMFRIWGETGIACPRYPTR